MTASLSATLLTGMLKLPPSELKKAQEVVAGENRPDLTLGAKPTPAPAPVEIPAPPAKKEATPSIAVATQVLKKPLVAKAAAPKGAKAKFSTLERADIRFRGDQINFLTDLELKLRRRNVCDERLTKASITRALVDLLPLMDLDLDNVKDEESLKELFIACWKSGPNRSKTA